MTEKSPWNISKPFADEVDQLRQQSERAEQLTGQALATFHNRIGMTLGLYNIKISNRSLHPGNLSLIFSGDTEDMEKLKKAVEQLNETVMGFNEAFEKDGITDRRLRFSWNKVGSPYVLRAEIS